MNSLRDYYLDVLNITRWKLRNPQNNITWHSYSECPNFLFFAEFKDKIQQELLDGIIRACAKNTTYAAGKLNAAIDNLQQLPTLDCKGILIFGSEQAQYLDSQFSKNGVYELLSIKVCVTYTLQELAAHPSFKRDLWQTWQNLMEA